MSEWQLFTQLSYVCEWLELKEHFEELKRMEIDKYKIIKTSWSSHPYVTGIKQSRHLQECFSTRSYGTCEKL